MNDTDRAIAEIRAALDLVPARSWWSVPFGDHAKYIEACSPPNLRALLDRLEAREAECERLRKLAMSTHLFEEAPCFLCGYNGPGYYQPEQHPCAALYHEAMEEQR